MKNASEEVNKQHRTATHSIIKEFVLANDLSNYERLARIAVLHAVLDASGDTSFSYYVERLFGILLERNLKPSDVKACTAAVSAVHKIRISHMYIVENCKLNEFGQLLVQSIAEAVVLITPESFLPMHGCDKAPNFSSFVTMNIEQSATTKTSIVKNDLQISRKRSPKLFEALDKLWSQQYTLNEDIMTLTNLPAEFGLRQFGLGASPAFTDTFSFRYTLDHRGRAYARSMYAQPQGDSFAKAVLNLGTKKKLGSKGLTALAIHYANVSGQDKLSLIDRKAWANNDGMGIAIRMMEAEGDWELIKPLLTVKEKKGFEMYAAACEYYRASTSGSSSNFESNLVCHQDATNSGFQFGAALLGNIETAESTNLLPSKYDEEPKDLYAMVATSMMKALVNEDAALAARWSHAINRTAVKKVVMVTGYGAGEASQLEALRFGLNLNGSNDMIAFVEDVQGALTKALEENASALLDFSKVMKQHATSTGEQITWITEDGFMVKHAYKEELAYGSGKYKIIDRSCNDVDEDKMASALPPNFIHSIDANMLRTAAVKARNTGVSFVPIHDSFGTHACDFFVLGRQLREAFIEVMSFDWYSNLCTENKFKPVLANSNKLNLTLVRKSTYMFS